MEGLCYPYSKNKGADQLRGYHEPDLRLFFAYAKSRFSHNAAHMVPDLEIDSDQSVPSCLSVASSLLQQC